MSKLTLHLQTCPGWVGEFATRSGVRWLKWMDPPKQMPAWAAGVKVIGRTFEPDDVSNDRIRLGAQGARDWFANWLPFYQARPWVYAWESTNEPQPMSEPGFRARLSEFTVELARLMHAAGLRLVGMNWSVGWPDTGTAAEMGPGVEACDYLGLHEYAAPAMSDGGGFWTLRYRRTIAELEAAGYKVPTILVTECGIDGGVVGQHKKGWRTFANWAAYLGQLQWYSRELDRDSRIVAATIFTAGPHFDWLNFEVGEAEAMQLANWLAQDEPPALPERARGFMASKYQTTLNWDAIKQDGYEYVMLRVSGPNASTGWTATEVDPWLERHAAGAKSAGLLVGGFHYLVPDLSGQAAIFAQAAEGFRWDLPLFCDVEAGGLDRDRVDRFLTAADARLAERGVSYPALGVYTNLNLWNKLGPWDRVLWLAQWNVDTPGVSGWTFWQSGGGTIPNGEYVSLDVYNGTSEELWERYGPEEETEPVELRVHDRYGYEKDWQWAADRYGVQLVKATPPKGATVFRLSEVRQKVGPCGMVVKTIDGDGNPLQGVAVLQGWVDGDQLPVDVAPRLSEELWEQPSSKPNRGNADFTNANGDAGWGWGPGEQYDPTGGWGPDRAEGAHWYWIMPGDNHVYTDVILGLGWLLGTDHDTLTLTFTRTTA